MIEKNIDIIFHKNASTWEEFKKVLCSVSLEQAYDILKVFSKIDFTKDSCIKMLKVDNTTSRYKSMDNNGQTARKTNLIISDFYFGGLKFLCEENIGNKDDNNFYRISNCFQNMKDGKCKCPVMSKVIGEIALPELYIKTR